MSGKTARLLVYRFQPDTRFEGQLVGALERIEVARAVKIVDGLFVGRDPETGELVATDLHRGRTNIDVASLLLFRLEPAERRRATERALSPDRGAVPGETVQQLGEALEPGAALVALLLEHPRDKPVEDGWADPLDDAVARTGGKALANKVVDESTLSDLTADLLAAAQLHDH